MTRKHTRKDDKMIDEMATDVKLILKILNGNGKIGLVAQTEINKTDIDCLKQKPSNIKNWLVAGAIILNTLVAGALAYNTWG